MEPEVQQDVNAVEPSATEQTPEVVSNPEVASQDIETTPQIETAPPAVEQQVVDTDEMGVPWKNRAMEAQRKQEKAEQQQQQILQKLETIGQPQQQYTTDELQEFAVTTDNDAHRNWALKEIRKQEKEENANIVRDELQKFRQAEQVEVTKKTALDTVMKRYPDAFSKDANGRIAGWNNNSALTQRIGQYMQNPEIANNPNGLLVAAALAHSDTSLGQKNQTNALKAEVKTLQKQTLVESGINNDPAPKTTRQVAIEKSQSGAVKDSVAAMKELWKATGRL